MSCCSIAHSPSLVLLVALVVCLRARVTNSTVMEITICPQISRLLASSSASPVTHHPSPPAASPRKSLHSPFSILRSPFSMVTYISIGSHRSRWGIASYRLNTLHPPSLCGVSEPVLPSLILLLPFNVQVVEKKEDGRGEYLCHVQPPNLFSRQAY